MNQEDMPAKIGRKKSLGRSFTATSIGLIVAGLTTFVVTVVMIIGAAIREGPFSQAAAGWAQFGGAVGSLLGAIWIGQKTLEAESSRQRMQLVDFVNGIYDAAHISAADLDSVLSDIRKRANSDLQVSANAMDNTNHDAFDAYLAVPIDRWPSPILYMRASRLAGARKKFLGYLQDVRPVVHSEAHGWANLDRLAEDMKNALLALDQSVSGLR